MVTGGMFVRGDSAPALCPCCVCDAYCVSVVFYSVSVMSVHPGNAADASRHPAPLHIIFRQWRSCTSFTNRKLARNRTMHSSLVAAWPTLTSWHSEESIPHFVRRVPPLHDAAAPFVSAMYNNSLSFSIPVSQCPGVPSPTPACLMPHSLSTSS